MSATAKWGVVAFTMGGPARPEEVQPFLERLFSDPFIIQAPLGPLRRPLARYIARRRAPKARQRYGLIGGSPILEQSQAQVDALAAALAADDVPVALAMAYTRPNSEEAVASLAAQGVDRLLGLPLYPQESHTTTVASMRDLMAAAEPAKLPVEGVRSYPTLPGLVSPLAARIAQAAASLDRSKLAVILTAHGLPERYIKAGDGYVDQVQRTAEAIRAETGLDCPMPLGFQSRLGPVKWVGPQVEQVMQEQADAGVTALIVAPITFVSEHLETLFDLDLDLRSKAWDAGIREYLRIPAIGTDPAFIADLAQLVRQSIS